MKNDICALYSPDRLLLQCVTPARIGEQVRENFWHFCSGTFHSTVEFMGYE